MLNRNQFRDLSAQEVEGHEVLPGDRFRWWVPRRGEVMEQVVGVSQLPNGNHVITGTRGQKQVLTKGSRMKVWRGSDAS